MAEVCSAADEPTMNELGAADILGDGAVELDAVIVVAMLL